MKKLRAAIILILALVTSGNLCAQKDVVHKDSISMYSDRHLYIKALDYSDRLYGLYGKRGDVTQQCIVLTKQAFIYQKLGDSRKALEILYEALALSQKGEDLLTKAVVLKRIGEIYRTRKDYKATITKYHEALSIAARLPNDTIRPGLVQALFNVHEAAGYKDSMRIYLKLTNKIKKAMGTDQGHYIANNNSFAYHLMAGDTVKAKKYMDTAIYYARKLKAGPSLVGALSNRAALYYYEGNFPMAKKSYDELLAITARDTTAYNVGDFYFTYSGILAGLGKHREAYDYASKAMYAQSDTYSNEVNGAIRDIEAKYALHTADIKRGRERLVFMIVLSVFLISLILLYFFYQNNKLKQKSRLADIERQTQQNLLSATLDAREVERKEIAAVLHDNISALLSSAGLQLTAFSARENPSEEIAKTRNILKEAHDKVRDLSHELVPTLLAKFGLAYALEDMCEKYSMPDLRFVYSDNRKIERYPEDFETKIFFITSELLNNALKHSRANLAKLDLKVENGLNISLEDNGEGFDTAKPDGFGLTQIKARIASMNGKVSVSSKTGAGTTIKIWVPL